MFKLLIVDDEKHERMGIAGLIKKFAFPFESFQSGNGEEALEMIHRENYDVLLTDIKMPFMNGIELIEAVQKLNRWMIFVIYSAYAEFEYAQSAVSLGVLKYLLKPISPGDFKKLFTDIETLCMNKNSNERAQFHEDLFRLSQDDDADVEYNRIVRMAMHLIRVHYADYNLGLSFLADKLKISSAYLSTLFKTETGQNVAKYIADVRIARAKSILKQGNLKIGEVGQTVGYSNESYFIKLFKSREGLSPAQFREQEIFDV
jgi:two-component system response regulator YesN